MCNVKTCFLVMPGVLVCIQHSCGVRTSVEARFVIYAKVEVYEITGDGGTLSQNSKWLVSLVAKC